MADHHDHDAIIKYSDVIAPRGISLWKIMMMVWQTGKTIAVDKLLSTARADDCNYDEQDGENKYSRVDS